MATQDIVFCVCCGRHLPRKREREHHHHAHYLNSNINPTPHKRSRHAFDAALTPRDKTNPTPASEPLDKHITDYGLDIDMPSTLDSEAALDTHIPEPGPLALNSGSSHYPGEDAEHDKDIHTEMFVQLYQQTQKHRHNHYLGIDSASESDEDIPEHAGGDGEASNVPLEDENDGLDVTDEAQDDSDQEGDLNMRDELREGFESRYAMIGASCSSLFLRISYANNILLQPRSLTIMTARYVERSPSSCRHTYLTSHGGRHVMPFKPTPQFLHYLNSVLIQLI